MDRRSLLGRAAAVACLPVLPASLRAASTSETAPIRRVRRSDPLWPSSADWERLNQEVGGRLIKVQSTFSACESALESAPCRDVIQDLSNPYYIGDQAGATQSTGWVDAWMSAPSAYAVAANTAADVVAAVRFAREKNLRLVVKGGGHSYQGTSNARRLAADMDAGDEQYRASRRLRAAALRGNRKAAAGSHDRSRRDVDRRL